MAGFLTDYANNKILDQLFGAIALPSITSLYFGLSQTPATKSGTVTEPSGGAYARASVPNDVTHFPAAGAGTKSNATAITFPTPTTNWGSIVSVFVADAAQGGNVIAMADLPSPKNIVVGGAAPSIGVGALFLSHT